MATLEDQFGGLFDRRARGYRYDLGTRRHHLTRSDLREVEDTTNHLDRVFRSEPMFEGLHEEHLDLVRVGDPLQLRRGTHPGASSEEGGGTMQESDEGAQDLREDDEGPGGPEGDPFGV